MKNITFTIDGTEDNPDPAEGTVMVYWKQFMAGWRRENDAIPRNTTLSVTNVCIPALSRPAGPKSANLKAVHQV